MPRKRPTQARARETVDAILQAATDLFGGEGYARTTTNRIAERAGVSIGSVYQYFPHKDAILAALFERHKDAVAATVGESVAALADSRVPLARGLQALIEGLCAMHDAQPRLTRAVSIHAPHTPRLDAALRKQEEAQVTEVEALLRARSDIRPGNRAVMAQLLALTTEALTRWLAHELPAELERRTVIDEIVRMLVRYLGS
jgi:AcrR family transcriptional regulator